MKFTSKITAALISVGLLAAASADEPVKFSVPGVTTPAADAAPAAAPAAPVAKFTEQQVLEAYGWYTGLRMGLHQLGFTAEQAEAIGHGLVGSVSGNPPPYDLKAIGPEIEAFLSKRNATYLAKLRVDNLAQGTAFFAKLKDNKNVVELPSGLRYEIIKAGTGDVPKMGQTVSIHYTGSLTTGQVFDSSIERGQPIDMVIQSGQLIPGMVEGLQKIAVGGKIRLYIPPALAYGDEGSQAIPPGATLIFEVELLSAKDTPPGAAAPAPAGK